jgi:hypothetical protein
MQQNLQQRVEVRGDLRFHNESFAGGRVSEGDARRVKRLTGTIARDGGDRFVVDVLPPRFAVLRIAYNRPSS